MIFSRHREHIDSALENFCSSYWPCEFTDLAGERCVNVRSGHGAKGHQSKLGKVLGFGDYQSAFSFESYRDTFRSNIYNNIVALCRRLQRSCIKSEEVAAARIHRELILPSFFNHVTGNQPRKLVSHTVCLCCLLESPEHALPCGHVICTRCLMTYSRQVQQHVFEISHCPMETGRSFNPPRRIAFKPPSCGIRVLSLDG